MRAVGAWHWTAVASLLALTFLALAHSFEDFAHNVPSERFDLDPTVAAVLLSAAFLVQGAVIGLVWLGWRLGYALALVVGAAWFVAAVLDHTGDLLDPSFRTMTSDLLILGIVGASVVVALAAAGALQYGSGVRAS